MSALGRWPNVVVIALAVVALGWVVGTSRDRLEPPRRTVAWLEREAGELVVHPMDREAELHLMSGGSFDGLVVVAPHALRGPLGPLTTLETRDLVVTVGGRVAGDGVRDALVPRAIAALDASARDEHRRLARRLETGGLAPRHLDPVAVARHGVAGVALLVIVVSLVRGVRQPPVQRVPRSCSTPTRSSSLPAMKSTTSPMVSGRR